MENKSKYINDILTAIKDERTKQLESGIINDDASKTKNDWIALICYYLSETSSRPDKHVSFEEFRSSLIKAGALIVSALETSLSLEESNISDLMTKLETMETKDD